MKNLFKKVKKINLKKPLLVLLVAITCLGVVGIVSATTTMDYANNQMTYQTGDTQELPIPVKDGYEFSGWWTKDGLSSGDWGTQVTTISATDMGNMDLYAKWNKPIEYLSLGGKVFYDGGDNGAEYVFYDSDKNEIIYNDIDSLDDAVYYSVEGTPSKDRFYVVASDSNQADYNYNYGVNLRASLYWGYWNITTGATNNTIGSGKTNTAQILAIADTSSYASGSIWEWLNDVNSNKYGGNNDWFIGSNAEYDALRASGKAGLLFYSERLWSSVEYRSDRAYYWLYVFSRWNLDYKDDYLTVVAFRAF